VTHVYEANFDFRYFIMIFYLNGNNLRILGCKTIY